MYSSSNGSYTDDNPIALNMNNFCYYFTSRCMSTASPHYVFAIIFFQLISYVFDKIYSTTQVKIVLRILRDYNLLKTSRQKISGLDLRFGLRLTLSRLEPIWHGNDVLEPNESLIIRKNNSIKTNKYWNNERVSVGTFSYVNHCYF